MYKLGIIGTGGITKVFLDAVELFDNIKLTTIYSRTEEKGADFGKLYGVSEVVTSLEELAKVVDIVYIANPNSLHFEYSKFLLKRCVHCIIEKPITLKTYELEELYNCAKENNTYFIEAIRPIHHTYINKIKKIVDDGEIGNIVYAKFSFMVRSAKIKDYEKGDLVPVFERELGGGSTYDIAVYPLHTALHIFGQPKKITSFTNGKKFNDVDSVTTIIFEYDNFHIVLSGSKVVETEHKNEIQGDKGNLVFDSFTNVKDVYTVIEGNKNIIYDELLNNDMKCYINNFLDILETKDDNSFEKFYSISLRHSKVLDEVLKQINY